MTPWKPSWLLLRLDAPNCCYTTGHAIELVATVSFPCLPWQDQPAKTKQNSWAAGQHNMFRKVMQTNKQQRLNIQDLSANSDNKRFKTSSLFRSILIMYDN